MKPIDINLSDPFEKTLARALALPKRGEAEHEEAVVQALRYLYTRAHGRIVETTIGPITIVRPAESSLKRARLLLAKRSDLLALAEQRTNFRSHAARSSRNPRTARVFFDLDAGRVRTTERARLLSAARRSDVPCPTAFTKHQS